LYRVVDVFGNKLNDKKFIFQSERSLGYRGDN